MDAKVEIFLLVKVEGRGEGGSAVEGTLRVRERGCYSHRGNLVTKAFDLLQRNEL